MRYLIINADDFGYNAETNKAISELFAKGLITSTSLIAGAPAAKEAATLSVKHNFPVGVHLTINSDEGAPFKSILPSPSLCDKNGVFHYSQKDITFHAKSREVSAEIEAQYQFLKEIGCTVDHCDNHCGTLYGINGRLFFVNAFRFCRDNNLPFRFPRQPDFLRRQFGGKLPAPLGWAMKAIAALGVKMGVKMLDDMITNPFSHPQSYEELRDYYISEIKASKHAVTEVFLHPSYSAGEVVADNGWTKRENELRLLQSGDLLQAAEDCGIELATWYRAFSSQD